MRDRIAVITGAGQGAGQAVALNLAAQGINVVLVGRTATKLESVRAQIGPKATCLVADVTDSAQVQTLAASLAERGVVDMLINCAGEALLRPIEQTTDADWARILAVNLTAPFLMARALLPLLRKSENASIINFSSKVAIKGYATVAAYTAAKAGLMGMTRALATELLPEEIRVAALIPGPMDTPMRWAATPDYDRKVVIDPKLVAEMVSYLVNLPRGVISNEILLQSIYYD